MNGRLRLRFERNRAGSGTVLAASEQTPPLQVVRAFAGPDGVALVHVHNLSGGVLGGDRLELAVEVGPGARAQLTSTGATRIYRARADACDAYQGIHVRVEENGLLEHLPDPIIPFAGARYHQATRIELGRDAGLFWWETVAPGRIARGEQFAYKRLRMELEVTAGSRPIARERFCLEPASRPLSSPVRLGDYHTFASLLICRVGMEVQTWLELEERLSALARKLSLPGKTLWGASALPAHGVLVRGLSRSGQETASGLLTFWRAAKRALYDQEAVPPRKIY